LMFFQFIVQASVSEDERSFNTRLSRAWILLRTRWVSPFPPYAL
jgi:hypothetical protein